MNYRHLYHAGNICDVVKHAVFALLVAHLKEKDKAFAVLDTHAGAGRYDLTDPRAAKTSEAEAGVQKLWAARVSAPAWLRPYLEALESLNPSGALTTYPGSPLLALAGLRAQDRLIACELHPEELRELRRAVRGDRRAQSHGRDGYDALKAFLPFPEKRGLVLIDPPFEVEGEFDRLIEAAKLIATRQPGACAALWYPIKDRSAIWRFHEALTDAALPEPFLAEFIYKPEIRHDRLNGSGLILLNPPWKLPEELAALFAALKTALDLPEAQIVLRPLTAC